jgi:hypothetical protein
MRGSLNTKANVPRARARKLQEMMPCGQKWSRETDMRSVEPGQVYVVRCIEGGQEDWRRLLVVGAVPAPPGDPTSEWAVQQASEQLETRNVLAATLLNDCDVERP